MALLPVVVAKERVIRAVADGATVTAALEAVDRAYKTYEAWRASDPVFKTKVDEAKEQGKAARAVDPSLSNPDRLSARGVRLDFATWRKEYLGYDTYEHQHQWIDVLEQRDPTPMEGCEWTPRNRKRVIINVPPFHSKTATVTIDYVTWRICMNPNVRIALVSKRREMAQKQLHQIKQRLTSPRFKKLQEAYAPQGGWKPAQGEGAFTQSLIYVSGVTADQKDPTVEALGMGAQIYGSRFDLIILDDCVVLSNANEYEKQMVWIESEVENRVKDGLILLVGTRLASTDLYSVLTDDDRYMSGKSPWSYLRQPMVRRFAPDPADWLTLWPSSSSPMDAASEPRPDGLYDAWPGPQAAQVRDSKPPAIWALVYQQQQTADDATFHPLCVNASVDRRRKAGPLTAGAWGHPRAGGEGMWTIASMDPAMAGDTFTVVGKVDRADRKRWIENAWVQSSPPAAYFREHIKQVTAEYGVNEWVIEEQGFQGFLVHDPEITTWLASRGCRITGHYTGKNKTDPDFGVASVAPLFGSLRRINEGAGREVHNGDNLISLPDPDSSPGVKTLIEELLTWVPGVRGSKLRQDGPMALWFWELRARLVLGAGDEGRPVTSHVNIPFITRGRASKRMAAPYMLRRISG